MENHSSNVVKTSEVIGVSVKNLEKENLGKIEEIILDKVSGKVSYVVLNSGSFLGLGGKLFALPWNAIKYDKSDEAFILNVDKEELRDAPGFDKDHWPDMADPKWAQTITEFYSEKSYWE
jgi:hypothetical protein